MSPLSTAPNRALTPSLSWRMRLKAHWRLYRRDYFWIGSLIFIYVFSLKVIP